MRTVLDRYLFAECLPTFGLSLAVFTFVLIMHRLLKLADLIVAKGVPLGEVLGLLLLALPALLPLLLPVSLLLAVLLAMGRLSADSEIVAMRACGVGLAHNLRATLLFSLLVSLLAAAVSLWAQPLAAREFKESLVESVKNRIDLTTETGVFSEIVKGVTLYAGGADHDSGELKDLFLRLDKPPAGSLWVLARSGMIREEAGGLALDLRDGEMHQGGETDQAYRVLRFQRYRLTLPLPVSLAEFGPEELPTGDLVERIRREGKAGAATEARMELHRRLALPAACLVFGLLGTALGVHHARTGKSRGVSLCLVVLLIYYALITAGKTLGDNRVLPPELAMWFPNLILTPVAVLAFLHKSRERPLPLEAALGRAIAGLHHRLHRNPGAAPP